MDATPHDDILLYLLTIPSGITFIHGKAGSGKTTLIRKLESSLTGCQVITPTNFAASLYRGARTIHSFFHASLDDLEEGFMNPKELTDDRAKRCFSSLQGLRMLVIDEISMVRVDLFEMMNRICQLALGCSQAFGGIPVVVVGDLFQLPPIVSSEAVLKYLEREYGGVYFFNSHVIQKEIKSVKLFELTKSFRQENDPEFVRILDAFRYPMTPQRKLQVLDGINSRVTESLPDDAVYIASSNEEVRRVNASKLASLQSSLVSIDAEYSIQKKDGSGYLKIRHSDLPIDEDIREIVLPSAYDPQLQFKIGAKVVFTKSSKYWGYVNGDIGTILAFNGECFAIRLKDSGNVVYCPNPNDLYKSSQLVDYRYDMSYDEVKHKLVKVTPYVQKTKQFPIKLAYAFTIHKAQGQTYDKVIIDLASHIFAPGQLYVALSRARSLDDLYLTQPITYSDIISDESILDFLSILRGYNGISDKYNVNADRRLDVFEMRGGVEDRFANIVECREKEGSTKECLLCALASYKTLVSMGEYGKASLELYKIVDILMEAYHIETADHLHDCIDHSDLMTALQEILDAYTTIVNFSHKQYRSDNRTIITHLAPKSSQ